MPPATALATRRTGAGPRVVLVHGFTQTGASFDALTGALADRFEVVAVDLPGHGRSGAIAVSGLREAAARLGEAGGPATYVGYSLGGRIALTLALTDADLVDRLVLVSTTAGIEDGAARAERRRADGALADRLDPPSGSGIDLEAFLAEWLTSPLFAHLEPQSQGLEARRENTPAGLAASLRAMGTGRQEPSWDRLGTLAMPVLAIAGERDSAYVAHANRIAGLVSNGRAEILPGVGHAVPFEAPEAFARLLTDFCR
jgi:2-succinyl-6-hydroxy-2,4-cyclohexadiene-1-carboxylate synthase